MYHYTANESAQSSRRQPDYDPPRYAVDGGRVFNVSAVPHSQSNDDGVGMLRSNGIVSNSVAGAMYIGQATQNVGSRDSPSFSCAMFTTSTQLSNNPAQINYSQSTGQRSMASTSTTGPNYGLLASVPNSVSTVQQQRQLVTPSDQQPRSASYSAAPEQYHHHHHVQQSQRAPPSNWPLASSVQTQTVAGGMQQRPVVSGPHGFSAPPPQMQQAQAPQSAFPNQGYSHFTSIREAPAPVFAHSSAPLPSTSAREVPPTVSTNPVVPTQSTSTREPTTPLPPTSLSEAEAALYPVRSALDGLWKVVSSAHTTALAKERDAHIASVRALNAERRANAQLQARFQAQMKREQELIIAAKGSVNETSFSEEMRRQVRDAINSTKEEGCKQGRKEGRQELNTLQLDLEGVQVELSEQKNLVAGLKAETERLRYALRASDRLVAYGNQEMLSLLLEIPPTREQAVQPQSIEDTARMHALLLGVDAVQTKLNEHRAMKRKVADLVQMLNMDLLALVDSWTHRGADVLLSSRWKKAWTVAAIHGQGSIRRTHNRTSTPASATPIATRKDSMTTHPSLLIHSRNGSMSASASPSILSSISRKASMASSATSTSTPPPSFSGTAPPVSVSSHTTPIDVDLEDTCNLRPPTSLATISDLPSPTTKYRGLLDVIAEARRNFGLPKTSTNSAPARADADIAISKPARQDYRSAYGLMALPPTPRDFNDPDTNDPDYDTLVPRLSPPAEDNVPMSQESSSSQWERGWRLRTPPPRSAPVSPATAPKELPSHIPSSPCLLKDVMPLKRVAPPATSSASPMIVDAATPLCLGTVSVPPVICTNDTGAGSATGGKRTRAEFEEGQDIHGYGESCSGDHGIEPERKRRAPRRPSLPPILVKPEPIDAVFDQTATLSLEGIPAPEDEQEMDELEGEGDGADATAFILKRELVDEPMPVHDLRDTSPEPVSAEEGRSGLSNRATLLPPTASMDDLEEGEITPDTPIQRTSPLLLPPPSTLPVCSVGANVAPTASLTRKQRPIPDMVRRTRPSDHSQAPAIPSSATHSRSPSKPKYTKLGISHINLLYRIQGHNFVCRMCETRPRDHEKALTVARYPENAPWDTLIDHCWRDHPVACEELERKKPSDIAEIRQRLPGSRFSRS